MVRLGLARLPNPDRHAAAPAGLGETVLIGRIVADEDGAATKERRFGHEGRNGQPFVHVARLEFDNHFSRDEAECRTSLGSERFGVGTDFRLALRDCTVMEGKSASLVLENEAGSVGCQSGELWSDETECRFACAVQNAVEAAVRTPAFDPVQPCCGAVPRLEEFVELNQRAAADQRKGSLALLGETCDQPRQSERHPDEFWTGRDLKKGPIYIEEHSGLQIEIWRRVG